MTDEERRILQQAASQIAEVHGKLFETMPSGKTRLDEYDEIRGMKDKMFFTAKVIRWLLIGLGAVVIGYQQFVDGVYHLFGRPPS